MSYMGWRRRGCFPENQFGGYRIMALDSEGDGGYGDKGVYFGDKMERSRKWV